MTKILSDKYPLLLILHLACLSSSCDLVTCTYRSHPPLWKEPKLDLKDFYNSQNFAKIEQQLIEKYDVIQ